EQYCDKISFFDDLLILLKKLYPCFDFDFFETDKDIKYINFDNFKDSTTIIIGNFGIKITLDCLFKSIDKDIVEIEFLKLKKLFKKYGFESKIIQTLNNISSQYIDSLTGVYNKEYLLNFYNNTDYSLIFLDLNDLKIINDTYGHYIGDLCIVEFGKLINSLIGKKDKVIRYGGDEFVILTKISSKEEIQSFIGKINLNLKKIQINSFKNNDLSNLKLETSTGYALCDNITSVKELLTISDEEMYKNKKRFKSNKKM
ncbi:MAG: GGDEF domain-containing protein, partial [Candidatus Gracilibacteria bacterium]|nr:GGDEF domain-containing protein [Candidatus Gracilibacteria bacterium]